MVDHLLFILTIITCVFCALYAIIFLLLSCGWLLTRKLRYPKNECNTSVTVIVPVRNEEANIIKCLDALLQQDYPGHLMQIVVANDHSDDATAEMVKKYADENPNVKLLNTSGTGKKNAIAEAIQHTSSELIVTTDGDCRVQSGWLRAIVFFYQDTKAKMIVAPVIFEQENSVFEKMQSLEFMALMGSTGGSLFYDKAVLCNGANLAYTREAYDKVHGFEGIDKTVTGDDVLLMYKISKQFRGSVKFLKKEEAVVYTSAKKNLSEFIDQRKRWASKPASVLNAETLLLSMVVFFFCFFLVITTCLSLFGTVKPLSQLSFLQICLILGGIKCIIDFLLLFLAATFFRRRELLILFLPEQFIYIFYVVVVGILGRRGKFEWKGRKI